MSKSHQHPLSTERKQTTDSIADKAKQAVKFKQELKRKISRVSRWLHIYVSMVSFAIVLFFAVTGITLNHADKFASEQRTQQVKGKLDTSWVNAKDTTHINKLAVVEYFRNQHKIKGDVSEFRIDDSQCGVSFKGPGYAADAFINRQSGEYELSIITTGFVGLINDLHKGRDTGGAWLWVIDISALFMVMVSITGIVLLLFIKKKRVSGIVVAVLGLALFIWLYYACII